MVRVAGEHGVVKDRLRLKDATHGIANIDVPATMALVAQTRDKLLAAAEPFAPLMVEGERVNMDLLRESTESLKPEDRLATRAAQLREMLIWIDDLKPPTGAETNRLWQKPLVQCDLAQKIRMEEAAHVPVPAEPASGLCLGGQLHGETSQEIRPHGLHVGLPGGASAGTRENQDPRIAFWV
jgi:hypothetical protein